MLKAIRCIIINDSTDDVEALRLHFARDRFNLQITASSCATEYQTTISVRTDVARRLHDSPLQRSTGSGVSNRQDHTQVGGPAETFNSFTRT